MSKLSISQGWNSGANVEHHNLTRSARLQFQVNETAFRWFPLTRLVTRFVTCVFIYKSCFKEQAVVSVGGLFVPEK